MAEFLAVFLLSIAMFIGCMVAGWIPLAFTLSSVSLKFIRILTVELTCCPSSLHIHSHLSDIVLQFYLAGPQLFCPPGNNVAP